MDLIKDLKQVGKDDSSIAGGKGASLGEMIQAGIPVPDGFVILSSAFEKFLKDTDLNIEVDSILHTVNRDEMHTIENASEKIKALILSIPFPTDIANEIKLYFKKLDTQYVAVRSSATAEDSASAAWAGQLESYLNTTEDDLLENIRKCWASLFTPRAIFYRFEKNLQSHKISVAVVVQKMVESQKSGVAFSVHPVTQNWNQIIIEAGFGLGEAIVGGEITPDSYVLEKKPFEIFDKNIRIQTKGLYRSKNGGNEWKEITEDEGGIQTLPDDEIYKLSEIVLTIEKHYGFPCDIEWAFENDQFFIVQSRPITTLGDRPVSSKKVTKEQKTAQKIRNFIESNEIDVQSAKASIFNISICYGSYMDSKEIHEAKLPSIYFHIKNEYFSQLSAMEDLKKMTNIYYQDTLRGGKRFQNFLKKQDSIMRDILKMEECLSMPIEKELKMIDFIREWWQFGLIGEDKGMALEKDLKNIFSEKGCSEKEIESIISILSTPENPSVFTKERIRFYELCIGFLNGKDINESIGEYIKDYFYIETSFYDYSQLTVDSIMNKLQKEVRRKDAVYFKNEIEKIKKSAKEIINERKNILRRFSFSKKDQIKIAFLHDFSDWLNTRKENMMKTFYFFSKILHDISTSKGIPFETITYYTYDEVKVLVLENIKVPDEEIKKRKDGCFAQVSKGSISFVYGKEAQDLLDLASGLKEESDLRGKVAYGNGVVTGKVKIIKDPTKETLNEGEVLVTSMTRIEFVPLMKKAKAIITDEGGISCHAAIVSRELKVPCIIGTRNATRILKNGDNVEMDTENGLIKVVK